MKIKAVQDGGWRFHCPGCDSPHVITDSWQCNGDVESPTISPSILVKGALRPFELYGTCHSFVTDGRIEFLSDCTHHLAGQTVELPDIERGKP